MNNNDSVKWLSILADIITICSMVFAIANYDNAFACILIIIIIALDVWNHLLNRKMNKTNKMISDLKKKHKEEELSMKKQIDNYKEQVENFKRQIYRIRQDMRDGKISSDLIINKFLDEVDNQKVCYEIMDVNVDIIFDEQKPFLDVCYCWIIKGRNPSKTDVLRELSFLIAGDSIVRNYEDLKVGTYIKTRNGNWQQVKHYIRGGDSLKVLTLEFGKCEIKPLRSFEIKYTYTWPNCYAKIGGDIFSFGTNTFSSIDPYSLIIRIESDKQCFSSADLQIRSIRNGKTNETYSELEVIESAGRHIVTHTLPSSCDSDRSIYIVLRE